MGGPRCEPPRAAANEGAPFVVAVHGAAGGWEPPTEAVSSPDEWVHGLSLGAMEAYDAACRRRSPSVVVVTAARDSALRQTSDEDGHFNARTCRPRQ